MAVEGGAGGEFEIGDDALGGLPVEEGDFYFGAVGVVADGAFASVVVVLDAGGWRVDAGFGRAGFARLRERRLLRRGFGGGEWCWGRGGLLKVGGPSFVRVKRRSWRGCRGRRDWD